MRVLLAILLGFMATAAQAQQPPLSAHEPTGRAQLEARGYLASCERLAGGDAGRLASCREVQAMFERFYVRAMAGDVEAQRQVAGELSAREPLVAERHLVQGCAWHMVIVAMARTRGLAQDDRPMQAACGQLPAGDVERARARASAIGREILRAPARPLPEPASAQAPLPPECLDSTARPMTGQLNDIPDPRQKPECRAALARQGRR